MQDLQELGGLRELNSVDCNLLASNGDIVTLVVPEKGPGAALLQPEPVQSAHTACVSNMWIKINESFPPFSNQKFLVEFLTFSTMELLICLLWCSGPELHSHSLFHILCYAHWALLIAFALVYFGLFNNRAIDETFPSVGIFTVGATELVYSPYLFKYNILMVAYYSRVAFLLTGK